MVAHENCHLTLQVNFWRDCSRFFDPLHACSASILTRTFFYVLILYTYTKKQLFGSFESWCLYTDKNQFSLQCQAPHRSRIFKRSFLAINLASHHIFGCSNEQFFGSFWKLIHIGPGYLKVPLIFSSNHPSCLRSNFWLPICIHIYRELDKSHLIYFNSTSTKFQKLGLTSLFLRYKHAKKMLNSPFKFEAASTKN